MQIKTTLHGVRSLARVCKKLCKKLYLAIESGRHLENYMRRCVHAHVLLIRQPRPIVSPWCEVRAAKTVDTAL